MKLRLQLLISISLLVFATLKVAAQSADEFFHTGAQAYLTNNTTTAREQVDKGLKLYPSDDKLKKLDELLKQQQQQQQQQNQQQKNQQQQQQNQSQSKQDQQKQQDQKKSDEQKKQDQQKQDQQKQQQAQKPDKDDDKQPPKDQPTPGEMTPDEAKKLLDSQKSDEKLLPGNQDKQSDRHHLNDW
jgi:hypothetical protein